MTEQRALPHDHELVDRRRPWRPEMMPLGGESLIPWLGGAGLAAMALVVVMATGIGGSTAEWAILVLGFAGLVVATALVALRSRSERELVERDARTRPAGDELRAAAAHLGGGRGSGSPAYVEGMARWTGAFLELLDHAATLAAELQRPTAEELGAAREDTAALHELLTARGDAPLGVNETASLHAVCGLWETNQARIESLAADVDPRWHRRWRSRTIVERRLRHGAPHRDDLVLPYRT